MSPHPMPFPTETSLISVNRATPMITHAHAHACTQSYIQRSYPIASFQSPRTGVYSTSSTNQSTNQPLSRPHTHKDKEPPKTQRTSKSRSMPSFRFFERVKAWKALDHSHRIVGLVPPQKNGAHRIKYPQRHLWAGFLLIGIPVFNSR